MSNPSKAIHSQNNSTLSLKDRLDKLVQRESKLLFEGKAVPNALMQQIAALMKRIESGENEPAYKPPKAKGPKNVRRPDLIDDGPNIPASLLTAPINLDTVADANETKTQAGTNDNKDAGSVPKQLPTFKVDEVMVLTGLIALGVFLYLNYGK